MCRVKEDGSLNETCREKQVFDCEEKCQKFGAEHLDRIAKNLGVSINTVRKAYRNPLRLNHFKKFVPRL